MAYTIVKKQYGNATLSYGRLNDDRIWDFYLSNEASKKKLFFAREHILRAPKSLYRFHVYFHNDANGDSVNRHFINIVDGIKFFNSMVELEGMLE